LANHHPQPASRYRPSPERNAELAPQARRARLVGRRVGRCHGPGGRRDRAFRFPLRSQPTVILCRYSCYRYGRMPPETPSSPVRAQVAAADLFCGVGGLTLGLRRSGIDVRIGVDIDPACRFPYEHNTGSRFASTDVSTLTANDLVEHLDGADCTLIAGCAPCQPFSSYSRGRATYASGRWGLLREFGRSRSRSRQR